MVDDSYSSNSGCAILILPIAAVFLDVVVANATLTNIISSIPEVVFGFEVSSFFLVLVVAIFWTSLELLAGNSKIKWVAYCMILVIPLMSISEGAAEWSNLKLEAEIMGSGDIGDSWTSGQISIVLRYVGLVLISLFAHALMVSEAPKILNQLPDFSCKNSL